MDWERFDAGAFSEGDRAIARRCEAALDPAAPADYRALAARLALVWSRTRPRRAGLGGGQGAGKSTLARLVVEAGARLDLRVQAVGLDDFYRTKAERRALAEQMHPLFATRGVPGTHDVTACRRALDALLEPGPVSLPVFDKGLDDRVAPRVVEGPFDLVLFEGWCVGAAPASAGEPDGPMNALEADADPEGAWRHAVDRALREGYGALWSRLDTLVFLAVPGLDAVRRWRLEQEQARPAAQRLDAAAVDRFVAHYERLTCRMLETLPGHVDWTVRLAEDHSIAAVERGATADDRLERPGEGET